MKKFSELGLSKEVLRSIEKMGYENPSPIQELLIPEVLSGKDAIGQAQTGTGKTLAYAASILSAIDVSTKYVQAIILVPTRELALQVKEEFLLLNKDSNFDVVALYGGSSVGVQSKELSRGADIVVGTPGRVIDFIKRGKLKINNIKYFVLDEADIMLDMGFLEDIEMVFKKSNDSKQVLLLSATMAKEIKGLASKYMKSDYDHLEVKSDTKTSDNVEQSYYLVSDKTRVEVLCRILDLKNSKRTIIFCETKREVDQLNTELAIRGYNSEVMHGDVSQDMRIKTLDKFKNGAFKFLIATDVAARGIHVNDIECVINYKLPFDKETYVHRIGRTGRASSKGEAISLVAHKSMRFLDAIVKFTKSNITRCELPSSEEIVKLKYQQVIDEANAYTKEDLVDAYNYVRDLSKHDLMNVAAALLKVTVDKQIGHNSRKSVEVKENIYKQLNKGSVRLFVNIGSKDRLKKGSLLDFLKEKTKIDKDNFTNIEILSTFTFVDVNSKVVDEFMRKIQNTKYNDRKVRVEKGKKQGK